MKYYVLLYYPFDGMRVEVFEEEEDTLSYIEKQLLGEIDGDLDRVTLIKGTELELETIQKVTSVRIKRD